MSPPSGFPSACKMHLSFHSADLQFVIQWHKTNTKKHNKRKGARINWCFDSIIIYLRSSKYIYIHIFVRVGAINKLFSHFCLGAQEKNGKQKCNNNVWAFFVYVNKNGLHKRREKELKKKTKETKQTTSYALPNIHKYTHTCLWLHWLVIFMREQLFVNCPQLLLLLLLLLSCLFSANVVVALSAVISITAIS